MELLFDFLQNTGWYMLDIRYICMIAIGILFCYLAIAKEYEPLLLLPIGFGVIIGNIPFFKGFCLGIYEDNSVLHYLYFGVTSGLYPSIVFLGLGAMTDFSSMLARPKLMCRRSDLNFFDSEISPPPDWSHCHSGVFLHGADSHYSAAYHETDYYQGGTPDSHAG